MAYTTLAAWELRGSATLEEKLVSVVGDYTLTAVGSPTSSATGVSCAADGTHRLELALPAELKVGFAWIIGGFRVSGSNPADDAHLFSLMLNNTGALDMSLGVLRAPNGQAFSRVAISGSSTGGTNHGAIPTDADSVFSLYKTALGVNNPGFRGRLNANAWAGFLVYNAGVDYTETARLVFGSTNGQNARLDMHWFAMGSGDITEEELEAIAGDPSLVLGSGEPEEPTLAISQQPNATQSGYLIDPAPVVHVLDAEGALDTSFTGDVTASLLGSGGVLLGTTTVAAVAGVATFSNLRPCEAGSYQLRFSASGYANLDSAVFEVTAGEGSTVIFTEEAPMRPIRRNEATANLRDIPITIFASDGSPWDGDPDEGAGVKAQLSVNFGTETPSPANIVKLAPGEFRVRPTDAYLDVAEGSIIKARVPAAAGRRQAVGWAHIIPADSYVNGDAARKALVDAIVIAADGGNGYNVVKQPESNQIQRTIPEVGVITITATFSPTVPGLVSAGGS